MDSKQHYGLAVNTVVQIIGKSASSIIGLATVAILTRSLGPAGYGELSIAITYLSLFAIIVDFGLTITTTQMISDTPERESEILGNLLTLRLVSGALFMALAPLSALFFPYSTVIKLSIAIGAIAYFFGTSGQTFIGVFQKRLTIHKAVLAELANRTVVLIGAALAMFWHIGLPLLTWILVAGSAVQLAIMLGGVAQAAGLNPRFSWVVWREIIGRSWPIGISVFFNLIYLRGDIIVLSLYASAADVGIYGAAYKVIDVVTSVPVMYMGLILPILTVAWSQGNKESFRKTMQQTFDFLAMMAVPLMFGALAVGVPVMSWVAGEDFAMAGKLLFVLGPASAVVFMGTLTGHAVVALKQQKIMTCGYVFVAILTVIGYFVLIPRWGIWAAAWLTLGSELLISILTALVVMKVSGWRPKFGMMLRVLFASAIMYGAIIILPPVHALVMIAAGVMVYFVTLSAIGGPKPRDVKQLFQPERTPVTPA